MKGRMFVVNSETIQTTLNTQIASIITPNLQGEQWVKTLADIMADMLQIEIGDYIFLWETSGNGQKSRIYGVYRAISKPYYGKLVALIIVASSSKDGFSSGKEYTRILLPT